MDSGKVPGKGGKGVRLDFFTCDLDGKGVRLDFFTCDLRSRKKSRKKSSLTPFPKKIEPDPFSTRRPVHADTKPLFFLTIRKTARRPKE